jgi:hypothetical protein
MPHGSDWINYLTALDDALEVIEGNMAAIVGASGWTERDQNHLRQGTQALRAAWLEARPEPAINRLLELLETQEHGLTARNHLELIASWASDLRELEDETRTSLTTS